MTAQLQKSPRLSLSAPASTFYLFMNIEKTGLTSEEFAYKLLEEKHIAVVPGNAFGQSGEGFVRVSYSYSVNHLTEAVRRIGEFLAERK
jgi:aminotransferase